jgi:hypothetical protein
VARVTPDQATAKWLARLSASTTQITDGVNAVTVAPGTKAAASKDLWAQRVAAAKDKWASRVGSVSLQSWQQSMINVGIPRIAQGAQQKQGKTLAFMQQFLPYLDTGVAKIKAMPKGDLQSSINRAAAMIQHNANFKRTG